MNKIIYNIIGMGEDAIKIGCILVGPEYKIAEDVGSTNTQDNSELNDTAEFDILKECLTFDKIEEIVFLAHAKEIRINLI